MGTMKPFWDTVWRNFGSDKKTLDLFQKKLDDETDRLMDESDGFRDRLEAQVEAGELVLENEIQCGRMD